MRNRKAWCLSAGVCLVACLAAAGVFDDVDFRASTEKPNPVGDGTVEHYRGEDVYTGKTLP